MLNLTKFIQLLCTDRTLLPPPLSLSLSLSLMNVFKLSVYFCTLTSVLSVGSVFNVSELDQ